MRNILTSNKINLAWLADQLGISPQGLNSRFRTKNFKTGYLMEINTVLGKDLFGSYIYAKDTENTNQQPILAIQGCAGAGIGLDGDENKIVEYVSIPSFAGCTGISVYGDSMYPDYKSGDIVFVRRIHDIQDIDYGKSYLIITREDRLLKKIYESTFGDEYLRLCSTNMTLNQAGERLYPDRNIPTDNILFLYKVVGSLRREQI